MARAHDDPHAVWVLPENRGVLDLLDAHVPTKLRKFASRDPFLVTLNRDFAGVIAACGERLQGPSEKVQLDRSETWINDAIREVYTELHFHGFAHSVECWQDDQLVGGLYGISLGGVFFGESMFSRVTNASKVAFVHLLGRMRLGGYVMLDTQFFTPHLGQFGVTEIPNEEYQLRLREGLTHSASLPEGDSYGSGSSSVSSTRRVLQSITHTS